MIAITFRFVAIDLPWYWSVSRADWLSSTNRPAGASQRSNEAPEVRRGSLRVRVCRLKSLRAHSPDGFGARRASIDGDIRAIFRERLLPFAKGLFAHASLCCSWGYVKVLSPDFRYLEQPKQGMRHRISLG